MTNYIEQAIKKAIEGGWVYRLGNEVVERNLRDGVMLVEHFLDPLFWQSLGKAMGWKDEKEYDGGGAHWKIKGQWKREWHRFIDHLAEGKTAEEYFKEIMKA